MSNVWLTIPSARPPAEAEKCLAKWRAQGYRIALWRDDGLLEGRHAGPYGEYPYQLIMSGPYPGYAVAVNRLIAEVLQHQDSDAEWFVAGGDDTEPDSNHTASEIARQCGSHFRTELIKRLSENPGTCDLGTAELESASTFGVMQPTGDRFAQGSIDKIAGSPWIGRAFCERAYLGKGPLWPGYQRFFMDEELQLVAQQYGVFQQRRDLVHFHRHYMRESQALDSPAIWTEIPPHLKAQEKKWNEEKALFVKRRALGFPGSELLP